MSTNERHDLPRLEAAPLNLSVAQDDEMLAVAYLLRMISIDLPTQDESRNRLLTMAHELEHGTEAARRVYKYARQRATAPANRSRLRAGISVVTDGELSLLPKFGK